VSPRLAIVPGGPAFLRFTSRGLAAAAVPASAGEWTA